MIAEYEENIRRMAERRDALLCQMQTARPTAKYKLRLRVVRLEAMLRDSAIAVKEMREYIK